MKYIFDIENRDGISTVKLDIVLNNNLSSGTSQIISKNEADNWDATYNDVMSETIDNMRLTVKEREEAYRNSHILSSFIFGNTVLNNDDKIICD